MNKYHILTKALKRGIICTNPSLLHGSAKNESREICPTYVRNQYAIESLLAFQYDLLQHIASLHDQNTHFNKQAAKVLFASVNAI